MLIDDLTDESPLASWARQAIDERLLLSAASVRTVMWLPLVIKQRVIGGLAIAHTEPGHYDQHQAALGQSLAHQAAIAIENARLYEQAQELATLQERQRLARELHDSLTQSLYSLTLLAEAAKRQVNTGSQETAQAHLDRIGDTAQQSLKEMRLLVFELRPTALSQGGLVGALQQRLDAVEGTMTIKPSLIVEGPIHLPEPVEQDLYGIAQEALNNALKHASATSVTVRICVDSASVRLEVSDDGCGFEPAVHGEDGGQGLTNMAERARRLGGELSITSQPGAGTTIAISLPATSIAPE